MYVWRLVGKPYYRISLIGTQYIENADQLSYANEHPCNNLILIKKYRYSKDVMLIGFGVEVVELMIIFHTGLLIVIKIF